MGPYVSAANDLMCIIRSHMEISEGCGLSHPGCYTVYSAPSRAKKIQVFFNIPMKIFKY